MRFDLITIFPDFFAGPFDHGILRRARETGLVEVNVQNLREFTKDRHRTVDDRPFGGGEGMVLKPEPLFEAVESLLSNSAVGARVTVNVQRERHAMPARHATTTPIAGNTDIPPTNLSTTAIVLLSASGKLFRQDTARRFAQL